MSSTTSNPHVKLTPPKPGCIQWLWVTVFPWLFSCSALFFFVLAACLLVLWLIVNLILPTSYSLRTPSEPISTTYPGNQVEFSVPAIVLADNQPVTVTLNLTNPAALTETLLVTVAWPSGLTWVGDPGRKAFTHTLSSTGPITVAFSLVNAHTLNGFIDSQNLAFVVSSELTPALTSTRAISISVEGEWSLAIRNFVNSTVNQNSPLLILVAGLVSGAGFFITQVLQQTAKKEDRDYTRIEKQEEHQRELEKLDREREQREQDKRDQATRMEQAQIKAQQLTSQFRSHFVIENFDAAKAALEELKKPDWAEHAVEDIDRIRKLLQLQEAVSESNLRLTLESCKAWADECVIAYIRAHERLHSTHPAALREARLALPDRKQVKPDLWGQLEALQREADLQPANWPRYTEPSSSVVADEPLIILERLGINDPLVGERAEDEQDILFQKPIAFWRDPKLYSQLETATIPFILIGPAGCGRTTLALALSRYLQNRDYFALYLPGQPTLPEIQTGFARLLLSFTTTNPTWLSDLTAAERELLARNIAGILGKDFVRAELKSAQAKLDSARGLEFDRTLSGKEAEEDKAQKARWKEAAVYQLQILEREVGQVSLSGKIGEAWVREMSRCARSFRFKYLTLILDVTPDYTPWLEKTVLPNLRRWQADGLLARLFLPETDPAKVVVKDGVTQIKRIKWEKEELTQLALSRFEVFNSDRAKRLAAEQEFRVLLQEALNTSSTPRELTQAWRSLLRQKSAEMAAESNTVAPSPSSSRS